MRIHKDLDVYKKSILFVAEIYGVTKSFPKEEVFGITSQMRRAAISISSNISEGAARQSDKEYLQFLYISLGSVSELDTQIEISELLGYIDDTVSAELFDKLKNIKLMLLGLIKSIKGKREIVRAKEKREYVRKT